MTKKFRKHNWDKYKQEYFLSKFHSPHDFLKENYGLGVGYERNFKTWKQEKIDFQKQELENKRRQDENLKEKVSQELGITTEELLKIKWSFIKLVNNKLAKAKETLSMRDIKEGLNIIKTELCEPTTITQGKLDAQLDLEHSIMITSSLEGLFMTDVKVREEFLSLIKL